MIVTYYLSLKKNSGCCHEKQKVSIFQGRQAQESMRFKNSLHTPVAQLACGTYKNSLHSIPRN
jgi:hypothetical protein